MKIVCESCQAKYSIADEKVAGKVFKIRCKRCGEVIIVRGDQQPDRQEAQPDVEAGAAPTADLPADAIWHVVINGEQFGPYVPAQIGEMLATNQIDWEAFVWREGFDNWLPAADVSELVEAIMGPGGGQAAEAAAEATPAAEASVAVDPSTASTTGTPPGELGDQLDAPASMGADPFAEEGDASNGLFGEGERGPDPGADLFDSASSPFDGGADAGGTDGVVASAASPVMPSDQRMTGARNENSVLFSLKNLQALATGSGTPEAAFSASSGGGGGATPGAGLAAGEGSGLIDIRALASAAGISGQEEGMGEKDELLAIGSSTGAFSTLGSPMAPTAPMEEGSKNKTVFAILGGAALVGISMIAVALIMKPPAPAPAPAVAAVAPVAPAETKPAAAKEDERDDSQLSEGERAARETANRANEGKKKNRRSSNRSRRRSRSGSNSNKETKQSSSSASASSPAPAAAVESAKPRKSRSKGSIDALLEGALAGSSKKRPAKASAPAASKSNLPRTPSRDQVLKALRGVQPAVSACAKGRRGGMAIADIVVGSSGRVKSVRVSKVGGPVASCIARAVRRARFPKFADRTFSVKFPFKL